MKFAKNLLSVSLLSLAVYAAGVNAEPTNCPSLSAIKRVGFTYLQPMPNSEKEWYIMQNNQLYDTSDSWDFGIIVPGTSKDDALRAAKIALNSLSEAPGPREVSDGSWVCEYSSTTGGHEGIAFTPSSPDYFPSHR